MDKEFYKEVAKRCLESGTQLHYLVRDIRSAVAHEAMISAWGDLEKASRKVGVDKATLSTYLGMGSREWNEKYGDIIQDIRFSVAHKAMLRSGGHLAEASRDMGVDRATFRKYLGVGAREWKRKYK